MPTPATPALALQPRAHVPRGPKRVIRRLLSTGSMAAAGAVLVAGCSLSSGVPSTSGEGSGPVADASITIDLSNYPSTLDPALQYDESTYSVYRNIYDQLLRRDPKTLEPTPWIATEWENTSPTEWTFTIRDDVTFSDGTPLTASDVAFSISRILDPALNSAQFANFSAIASAEATSPTELKVTTKAPSPTLLTYLTTLSIVPQAYVEEVGAEGLNSAPVGSGPYTLEAATAGSEVRLTRNDSWWSDAPSIEDVVFRSVPDASARLADLQSGTATLALGLTADQAIQLESGTDVEVLSAPTERVAYLGLNALGDTATSDPDIREAIKLAIDYDSIIDNLLGGYASPVGTILTPLAFGYPDGTSDNEYDPDRAKALIEQSGIQDPELVFPSSPSYDPQIIQAIQSDLEAVGFSVSIENSDQATYLKKVQSPAHDWGSLRFGLWSCSCLDADGVLYPLFRTDTIWSSWSDPDFDALVDHARTTLDEDERVADYEQAVSIVSEQTPGIGLYQVDAIYGAAPELDWTPDAVQSLFVDQMSLGG